MSPKIAPDLGMAQEKSQTFLEGAGFLNGADYRIRTDDLPLTRRLLYQLS